MGFFRTTIQTLALAGAGSTAFWQLQTHKSEFIPLSANDSMFYSPTYLQTNPNKNPTTHDLCARKVPLQKIKPQLLKQSGEGKLVQAFCAGVWSGWGYAFQRSYLSRKYQNNTTTAHQLWSRAELKSATYELGAQITDHFEVVEKCLDHITMRCGDSPLKTGVRDSEGLFEIGVQINLEEDVAVFSLKSVFYQGVGRVEGADGPLPGIVEWAHRLYTKALMESAILNVVV